MIMIIILKWIIEEVEPEQIATPLSAAPQEFVSSSKNEGRGERERRREGDFNCTVISARLH
jgi:hypothetical protein